MSLEKEQTLSLLDAPDQRICRLLLDNRIAKTLAAVALAVQLVLPPLALEGTFNKSKRLGTSLIAYFMDGASKRSGEFVDALQRGFGAGILKSSDQKDKERKDLLDWILRHGGGPPRF